MDTLLRDLRLTLRRLRRAPGFTAVVLLTLAIGIGATTGLFGAVDAAILHPVRFHDPEQLVTISHSYHSKRLTMESEVSAIGFRDYRAMTTSFSAMAAQFPWTVNLSGTGDAERVTVSKVSGQFFTLLGVSPQLGRLITPADDAPGQDHVVVLSHDEWRQRFGGDPAIIGHKILLDNEQYTIIGVTPKGFTDFFIRRARHWVPLAIDPADYTPSKYTNEYLRITARLKPHETVERARAELTRVAKTLRAEYPNALGAAWGLSVTPLEDLASGGFARLLLVLLGAVALVLLIACANVANLLLARASARTRDVAVRTALGASRATLIRQYLTESIVLALSGGALGLAVAFAVSHSLAALLPQLPQAPSGVLGGRVVLFALAASVVTGLAFGLIPAFRAGRTDIRTVLGDGRQGAHAERFGGLTLRVLVVAEVALAFVLLTGATLLIQSVVRLTAISPGFNTQRLLTFKLALPDAKYRTDDARSAFAREALAAVARVPGVTAVAGSNALPLAGNNWSGSFTLEGYSPATMSDMPWGDIRIVNADYFSTMQIPVREGRTFSASDVAGAEHVAVVDELFAKRFGEGRSVIGRRISYGRGPTDWWTIVGVVGNTMQQALDAKPRLHVYRALEQYGQPQLEVAVRTGDDPYRLVAPLRAAIAAIDRGVPVADIRTMDDLVTASLGQRRVAMLMLAALAAVALALAALGVYGVISYIVSLRLRELGVRMALGANGAAILGNVISRGMSLAAVGVVVGAVISLLVSRVLATQLYAVKATDPVALVVAAAALSATAFVATSIPAWRATRLDVSAVLRDGS